MKKPIKKRKLGVFEIVKDLAAKGAQGKLYVGKALEPAFGSIAPGDLVALKVMEVHDDDGERAFRRLKRRTDALVAAANAGIVRYYGCFDASDESSDRHVIVMELLKGRTLEEHLAGNRLGLDADYVLRIIRTCTEALVRVSEYGLVHRDIKPSNIFLCADGGIKLIDFEIAMQEGASRTTTESGAMRGTVDYMAPDFHPDFRPEKGFRGDECSDVFSLTVCLYEMLAGTRPYAVGGAMGEQSMMAYFQRWTKVAGADVSKSLKIESYKIHALAHVQKVIKKGLSPERVGRYQSYFEFWQALQDVRLREITSPEARYELLRCVGKGGFGVVFRARRKSDGLVVAIKCLLRAEYAERFQREAKALSKFHDDRLVSFVEYFAIARNADETFFIVMQFLDGMPGSSLRDRIASTKGVKSETKLPAKEILTAFKRFAGGLGTLHNAGIIHRDVKPANLYMPEGAPERACLMDLGVVKTEETKTNGSLPGTLDYMPPEMALGQSRGTPAADFYALGLCLFEALTGNPLFPRLKRGGDGLAEFYRRANDAAPPDLSSLDGLPAWKSLVAALVAHDPKDRLDDGAVVIAVLESIPNEELPEAVPESSEAEDDDDDTFAGAPRKIVRHFGSEVGFRLDSISKSEPSFHGNEDETDSVEDIGVDRFDAADARQPAVDPKHESVPAKKAGAIDDETKTAAISATPSAKEAVETVVGETRAGETVAGETRAGETKGVETVATRATIATNSAGGKTVATMALPEAKPVRIELPKGVGQRSRVALPKGNGEVAGAAPGADEGLGAVVRAKARHDVSAVRTPEGIVVAHKAGVRPWRAAAIILLFLSLGGAILWTRSIAERKENEKPPIASPPPRKPTENPIQAPTREHVPVHPDLRRKPTENPIQAPTPTVVDVPEEPAVVGEEPQIAAEKKAEEERQARAAEEARIAAERKAEEERKAREEEARIAAETAAFTNAVNSLLARLDTIVEYSSLSDIDGRKPDESFKNAWMEFGSLKANATRQGVIDDNIYKWAGESFAQKTNAVAQEFAALRHRRSEEKAEKERREKATNLVRGIEKLRDGDKNTMTQTSEWSREEYRAFAARIEADAAKVKKAVAEGTGYADLDRRLQKAASDFADLRGSFDAIHPVLFLSNTMKVPVTYYVNGVSYEVQPNGGKEVSLKPCADARITARVSGTASADYYEMPEKVIMMPASGRVQFSDIPNYRGNPTLRIRNKNGVAVQVRLSGGTWREIPAGGLISEEGTPRASCTVDYKAPVGYSISGSAMREAKFGNAGAMVEIAVPEFRLLPRIVSIENPVAGNMKWRISTGGVLDDAKIVLNLPEGIGTIRLEPVLGFDDLGSARKRLKPEYESVEISVEGLARGVENPLRFAAKPDQSAINDNCRVLESRMAASFPSDLEKADQAGQWLPAARLTSTLLAPRYDGIRDSVKMASWRKMFGKCDLERMPDGSSKGELKSLLDKILP